jgi:hypothetical protein
MPVVHRATGGSKHSRAFAALPGALWRSTTAPVKREALVIQHQANPRFPHLVRCAPWQAERRRQCAASGRFFDAEWPGCARDKTVRCTNDCLVCCRPTEFVGPLQTDSLKQELPWHRKPRTAHLPANAQPTSPHEPCAWATILFAQGSAFPVVAMRSDALTEAAVPVVPVRRMALAHPADAARLAALPAVRAM